MPVVMVRVVVEEVMVLFVMLGQLSLYSVMTPFCSRGGGGDHANVT